MITSFFIDFVFLSRENPNQSTKKSIETNKLAPMCEGYKKNIQKSTVSLCTSNE